MPRNLKDKVENNREGQQNRYIPGTVRKYDNLRKDDHEGNARKQRIQQVSLCKIGNMKQTTQNRKITENLATQQSTKPLMNTDKGLIIENG